MLEFIQSNLFLLACVSAGLCVTFATYVIIDFVGFTSARYKQKYLQETAIVMDDVLLQLPPQKALQRPLLLPQALPPGFLRRSDRSHPANPVPTALKAKQWCSVLR